MGRFIAVIAVVLGCWPLAMPAAQPATATGDSAPRKKPRMVCTKEKPMGSNRPVRICRDADATDEAGEAHRDELRELQKHQALPPAT